MCTKEASSSGSEHLLNEWTKSLRGYVVLNKLSLRGMVLLHKSFETTVLFPLPKHLSSFPPSSNYLNAIYPTFSSHPYPTSLSTSISLPLSHSLAPPFSLHLPFLQISSSALKKSPLPCSLSYPFSSAHTSNPFSLTSRIVSSLLNKPLSLPSLLTFITAFAPILSTSLHNFTPNFFPVICPVHYQLLYFQTLSLNSLNQILENFAFMNPFISQRKFHYLSFLVVNTYVNLYPSLPSPFPFLPICPFTLSHNLNT